MRKVLVTGGARGIGRAIVEDLARDHSVATTWHVTPPDDLLAAAPGVLALQADLSDVDAVARVVADTVAGLGGLDVIVNNAATISPSDMAAHDPEVLRETFDLNLGAPAAILSAALPHLGAGAAVVNITSVNARFPPLGAAFYSASKAALEHWTRAAARELGPRGIRVNAVAPGAVEVPEAPRDPEIVAKFVELSALGRLASPQDIAAAVRFLSSDAAGAITGEVLRVSAGYRL